MYEVSYYYTYGKSRVKVIHKGITKEEAETIAESSNSSGLHQDVKIIDMDTIDK